MRIVHVAPRNFLPASDGGRVKAAAIASALASCGELHVVDIDRRPYPGIGEPSATELALPFGGSARFHLAGTRATQPAGWLSGLRTRLAYRSRRWRVPAAVDLIHRLAPDVVVGDDISCIEVASACAAPLRIQHLHNVESRLQHERARLSGRPKQLRQARHYEWVERQLLPGFDQVWAVSQQDLRFFRSLGVAHLRLAPNVVAMSAFDPQPAIGPAGVGLFFGSLGWEPNATAVEDLCGMAGRLREQGFAWRVGGKGASDELRERMQATPDLEYLGFVPSLIEAARQASAVLVPITWGGGTKVKTIEAMALAKPIITTPEGAEGIDLIDGEHALIRPLGPAFDQAVTAVLRDPARYQGMALRAQRLARERYSQLALNDIVRAALDRFRLSA